MPTAKQFCILGLGYIGLPTAVALAKKNQHVVGVDINPLVVDRVNKGLSLVMEPLLATGLKEVVERGLLKASTLVVPSDVYMIAVPTPFKEKFTPDISFVEAASDAIAPFLKKGDLVIIESTSPVGTTRTIAKRLSALRQDLAFPVEEGAPVDVHMAYCPERVLPGKILHELAHNNRIVGGMTALCTRAAEKIYALFVTGEITGTSDRHAEMAKLCENAFRDVNIAFANELSMICDAIDLNVWEVIKLANKHPRVNILNPGPGVGGHCIAVDPWFIVDAAPEKATLIRTAREVNLAKTRVVIEEIKALCQQHAPAKLACLGLSFKANVDDLRESPALEIVESIAKETAASIQVVEPFIEKLPESLASFQKVKLSNLPEALSQCTIVILLVDHFAFESIDKSILQQKIVLDTRGVLR